MGHDETYDSDYAIECALAWQMEEHREKAQSDIMYWETRCLLAEKTKLLLIEGISKHLNESDYNISVIAYNKFIEENKEPK